tara:strand:+ start:792 stop:953 length:162 start_codon:yes stop_codon:yes gene_type:complete
MRKAEEIVLEIRGWLDDTQQPPLTACLLLEKAEQELRRLDRIITKAKGSKDAE